MAIPFDALFAMIKYFSSHRLAIHSGNRGSHPHTKYIGSVPSLCLRQSFGFPRRTIWLSLQKFPRVKQSQCKWSRSLDTSISQLNCSELHHHLPLQPTPFQPRYQDLTPLPTPTPTHHRLHGISLKHAINSQTLRRSRHDICLLSASLRLFRITRVRLHTR